jgi:hypothetical protein
LISFVSIAFNKKVNLGQSDFRKMKKCIKNWFKKCSNENCKIRAVYENENEDTIKEGSERTIPKTCYINF